MSPLLPALKLDMQPHGAPGGFRLARVKLRARRIARIYEDRDAGHCGHQLAQQLSLQRGSRQFGAKADLEVSVGSPFYVTGVRQKRPDTPRCGQRTWDRHLRCRSGMSPA